MAAYKYIIDVTTNNVPHFETYAWDMEQKNLPLDFSEINSMKEQADSRVVKSSEKMKLEEEKTETLNISQNFYQLENRG